MIKCLNCKRCIQYFFEDRPKFLCISNDKYIQELTKDMIKNCKKFDERCKK